MQMKNLRQVLSREMRVGVYDEHLRFLGVVLVHPGLLLGNAGWVRPWVRPVRLSVRALRVRLWSWRVRCSLRVRRLVPWLLLVCPGWLWVRLWLRHTLLIVLTVRWWS